MNQIVFGWGFAPDLTGGAYSVPPDLWLFLGRVGPLGKGERKEGEGRKGV